MTEPAPDTQSTFALPDVNTPEVAEAIVKQERSGPNLLPWELWGRVQARVVKVKAHEPGKKPAIIIEAVVISSPHEEFPAGSGIGFYIDIAPHQFPNIYNARLALLKSFVGVISNTARGEEVDMKAFEKLIEQGRLPEAVSEQMQFIWDRSPGNSKMVVDKDAKPDADGRMPMVKRTFPRDSIHPPE